jgi:cobalamin synthase
MLNLPSILNELPPPAIIALSAVFFIFIVLGAFYITILINLFQIIKKEYSIPYPWTVWFTMIPILGPIWWFYLIFKAKSGTEKTLSFYNSNKKSNAGFYWFLISAIFYLIFLYINNNLSYLTLILVFIFTITFSVHFYKVYQAKKLILLAIQNAPTKTELH